MSEFTLFPLLPTELRLKIWQQSLPQAPSLLPRTSLSVPLALLSTCRESRLIHRETFSLIFTPVALSLFTHPISLYYNPKVDETLYIDDVNTLTMDFKDWMLDEGRRMIKGLAVTEEVWRLRGPTRGEAVLEARGDARFMMLHPGSGLGGLDILTLVQVDLEGWGQGGKGEDRKRLIKCGEGFIADKAVLRDVKHVFDTLNGLERLGLYDGWREPEFRSAVVTYD